MDKNIIEHTAYEKGIKEGLERGKRECHRVVAIKEDLAYEKGFKAGYAVRDFPHIEKALQEHGTLLKREELDDNYDPETTNPNGN